MTKRKAPFLTVTSHRRTRSSEEEYATSLSVNSRHKIRPLPGLPPRFFSKLSGTRFPFSASAGTLTHIFVRMFLRVGEGVADRCQGLLAPSRGNVNVVAVGGLRRRPH